MNNNLQQLTHNSTYHKIKIGLKLKDMIEESNIAYYPALYIGSRLDLEFPLLLRARKIIFVDPFFQEEENIHKLFKKVLNYDSKNPKINKISSFHWHISFVFDFGAGLENVHLDIFSLSFEKYNHILPLAYIIEFNSVLEHSLYKTELLEKLIVGGFIINNNESPLRQHTLTLLDILSFGRDLNKIEDNKATNMGLRAIRIDNVPFAIYQKQKNNSKLLHFAEKGNK